jgi:hypothetical protein
MSDLMSDQTRLLAGWAGCCSCLLAFLAVSVDDMSGNGDLYHSVTERFYVLLPGSSDTPYAHRRQQRCCPEGITQQC